MILCLFHALTSPPKLLTSRTTTLKWFIIGMKPMSIGRNPAKTPNSIIVCIKSVTKEEESQLCWMKWKKKRKTHKQTSKQANIKSVCSNFINPLTQKIFYEFLMCARVRSWKFFCVFFYILGYVCVFMLFFSLIE